LPTVFATSSIRAMAEPILAVADLSVAFSAETGAVEVVRGISFSIGTERVALVGESGSGKTMTARAVMGLVPAPGRVRARRLDLLGNNLLTLDASGWNHLRGAKIGLVLQDPRFALNPVHSVGRQVEEPLLLHGKLAKAERRERALQMLAAVGLDNPAEVYRLYPGELSGGMGQRVMIAAMLIAGPQLLVADEPTSALDQELRDQVLDLLTRLVAERGMGLLLISHDLQQVARFADRALVMYRGRIVDEQPAASLARSDHPYTRTLWECRPSAATYGTRLPTLRREELELAQ
jgi:peptide/nickel transport system ATP-binding protein